MVIGYHCVVSPYGFWLPNDPRGSWSDFVRCWELLRFGSATKVDTHRSVAHKSISRQQRQQKDDAKRSLLYPPVQFDARQIQIIADALADGVARSGFQIYAAAILKDHSHWVIGRHSYPIEQVVNRLKGAATRELTAREAHPLAGYRDSAGKIPSPWAQGLWKVFLSTPGDIDRSARYAAENLRREGMEPQNWPFLVPFQPE